MFCCCRLYQLAAPHGRGVFRTPSFQPVRLKRGFKRDHKLVPGSSRSEDVSRASILVKPFFFSLGVSCVSFTGAAIWQYESLRKDAKTFMHGASRSLESKFRKAGAYRNDLSVWWQSRTPAQKVTYGIVALNACVFLAWRIPAAQTTMHRFFVSNPYKESRCVSMLLSTFSHQSLFHFLANMYVLMSFSGVVCQLLGKEQFVAVYLSAGVFSNLASYAAKTIRPTMIPSLGASGAIMAMLGATCISHPDARLAIAFVGDLFPHSFSASGAMKAIIIFDCVGLALGWKVLDHAAHLGGMAFGIWYVTYGRQWIWSKRGTLMKKWHQMRDRDNKG